MPEPFHVKDCGVRHKDLVTPIKWMVGAILLFVTISVAGTAVQVQLALSAAQRAADIALNLKDYHAKLDSRLAAIDSAVKASPAAVERASTVVYADAGDGDDSTSNNTNNLFSEKIHVGQVMHHEERKPAPKAVAPRAKP
jgi:hypothetical protein